MTGSTGNLHYTATMHDGQQVAFNVDRIEVTRTGDLVGYQATDDKHEESLLLLVAKGMWKAVYASSLLDGHAVCVWTSPRTRPVTVSCPGWRNPIDDRN